MVPAAAAERIDPGLVLYPPDPSADPGNVRT